MKIDLFDMGLRGFVVLLGILFFASPASALECKWWQTQVDGSTIPRHPRQGHSVRQHPRNEHCREKWKGADTYIKQFRNDPIKGWPHKEIFKAWTKSETESLLQLLSSLPSWAEANQYQFYRALKSDIADNPARSELIHKSIIFYDSFFIEKNKPAIIVHESAHHLYQRLGQNDKDTFKNLSGWFPKVDLQTRSVFEHPPIKLIKSDSSTSVEEDFTNHVEEFFKSPNNYQKSHPQLYKFLNGRFNK